MLRGNGGQDIFFDEDDRYHLYLLMQEGVERFGHRIHGFCCMHNHLRLAVQVTEDLLSRIMQNLAFSYTRWVNKKQSRTGHLFQGPYNQLKSFAIAHWDASPLHGSRSLAKRYARKN